jgi:CRP-like cAMP-binding protein
VPTIAELKERADHALFEEDYKEALRLYTAMVQLQPGNLDARLRVGDALLALGEVQGAAVVYTALARNAALAGYPLRALTALRILSTLEPKLSVLLEEVARLYGSESPRIGKGSRRTLPSLEEPSDETVFNRMPREHGLLVQHGQNISSRYDSDSVYFPERLFPIPLLSLLPLHDFVQVLSVFSLVRVRPDTWILRQGERGHSFYVLARGTIEISTEREGETVKLAQPSEGTIFGEMVLLSDAPRTASVRAVTDCDLLEFDLEQLNGAKVKLANLSRALDGFARERLLTNVTLTSPLFRPLDARERVDLVRRFVGVDKAANEVVIREGEVGTGLYVVLRGEVAIERGEQEIARLGPSELFGEISLVRREPTSATVRARTGGAQLLFLHRDYFERLIGAFPELRAYFEGLSDARLTDLRSQIPESNTPASAAFGVAGEEIEVELLF